VTAAGVRPPAEMPVAARVSGARAGLRLAWLFLAGRRVPAGLVTLALCAGALAAALSLHWTLGSASGAAQQVPVLIEAGAAGLIAVTTYSPFGEPERATGRWLPWLRLGTAVALTGAAVGALAAGAAAGHLNGGTADLLRNVAGMTGIGLLSAAVTGGALAWVGPMAYMLVAEFALSGAWTTPWAWPARPPHDVGAALCAAVVFAAGAAVTTVRGARAEGRAG
jgi:hypothetical protein